MAELNHKMYAALSPELCKGGKLLLKGPHILIPKALRPCVLALAPESHLGVVGTKQNLHTKVWWPGMDK